MKRSLNFSFRALLLFVFVCAIGTALFQRFYVPPIERIRGLRMLDDGLADAHVRARIRQAMKETAQGESE